MTILLYLVITTRKHPCDRRGHRNAKYACTHVGFLEPGVERNVTTLGDAAQGFVRSGAYTVGYECF